MTDDWRLTALPNWLEKLWYREAWLMLEALEPATLPPYLGSTLRGALGYLLQAALCEKQPPVASHQSPDSEIDGARSTVRAGAEDNADGRRVAPAPLRQAQGRLSEAGPVLGGGAEAGRCPGDCRQPDRCRYYSLFVRGGDDAKPYLILPPPLPGLEEVATGSPVSLPYRAGPPRKRESVPTLRCEAGWSFAVGGTLSFGLRIFGTLSNALPAIIEGIARWGLRLGADPTLAGQELAPSTGSEPALSTNSGQAWSLSKGRACRGAQFRLVSAHDGSGQLLYDRRLPVPAQMPMARTLPVGGEESARRIRIVFLTPAVFKPPKTDHPTFSPRDFADRFFESCIGRAVNMQMACSGTRPPWVDSPRIEVELTGHRLYHYELPRYSFRQGKRLDFDGAIGYIDVACRTGDLRAVMPWARAAELLHFGQKAAFGLGKVRVLTLE